MSHVLYKPPSLAESSWREQLRLAYTDPKSLLEDLNLLPSLEMPKVWGPLSMRVPKALASRIRPNDPNDPILRQILPSEEETHSVTGFSLDPVGDNAARQRKGLLHKYHGRVLLITTGACAVHCRYCFRQNFGYAQDSVGKLSDSPALEYIATNPSIKEVILSGGDPFMLSTQSLEQLTNRLRENGHIETLRIHTRMPVVLPDRITSDLLEWLASLPWAVVIVIHANHANEFDASVDLALSKLRGIGAHLLNQAVLLRGINDNAEALEALARRSFQAGVLPYYLHRLDPVAGSHRYEVRSEELARLMTALRTKLSGYLVPRLVQEIEGAPYKVPLL